MVIWSDFCWRNGKFIRIRCSKSHVQSTSLSFKIKSKLLPTTTLCLQTFEKRNFADFPRTLTNCTYPMYVKHSPLCRYLNSIVSCAISFIKESKRCTIYFSRNAPSKFMSNFMGFLQDLSIPTINDADQERLGSLMDLAIFVILMVPAHFSKNAKKTTCSWKKPALSSSTPQHEGSQQI